MNRNIFITGGLGQDGRILTSLLQAKNINLNIISKSRKKIYNDVNYIKLDLLNISKIRELFKKTKPDIVVHLAANNPSYGQKDYKLFYLNNYIATINLFNSTFIENKKAKFIFCSSSQIFKKKNGIVNEKSKVIGLTDYTKFRIKSHNLMLKYKKKHNITYTNAILFNHDSKLRNKKFIIPQVINALFKKNYSFLKKIINENITADFSHAEDICVAIKKIISKKINLDTIILSSNKLVPLNKIIEHVIKQNKINIKFQFKKKKLKGLIGDNKLAKKKLNWKPKLNIFKAADEIYQLYNK